METITCQFSPDTSDYVCSIPYIEKMTDNGQDFYVSQLWSGGEIFIAGLITFAIGTFLTSKIIDRVWGVKVSINKKYL